MATTNVVPTIASSALPSSPANEWAENTNSILDAHQPSTPDPQCPGAFPGDADPAVQRTGERPTTHAEQPGKTYFPVQQPRKRKPARPRRAPTPHPGRSTSTLGGISTIAHTGTAASLHPVSPLASPRPAPPSHLASAGANDANAVLPPRRQTPPVLSKFVEGLTPPVQTGSPSPLSSSASAAPAPARLHAPVESSGRSEGVPGPPNSLATGFAAGAPDVLAPPAPRGVFPSSSPPAPTARDFDDAHNSAHALPPDTHANTHPNAHAGTGTDTDSDGTGTDPDTDASASADGTRKKKTKTKVPLVQRLKDKIHIGHHHHDEQGHEGQGQEQHA
ncbi:hypothetical protein B0H12DRAFT_1156374 [Mycena haematopus]|nr:hypothetical protein B0H12DRAFT_1156374 [Mycena haematopus]